MRYRVLYQAKNLCRTENNDWCTSISYYQYYQVLVYCLVACVPAAVRISENRKAPKGVMTRATIELLRYIFFWRNHFLNDGAPPQAITLGRLSSFFVLECYSLCIVLSPWVVSSVVWLFHRVVSYKQHFFFPLVIFFCCPRLELLKNEEPRNGAASAETCIDIRNSLARTKSHSQERHRAAAENNPRSLSLELWMWLKRTRSTCLRTRAVTLCPPTPPTPTPLPPPRGLRLGRIYADLQNTVR